MELNEEDWPLVEWRGQNRSMRAMIVVILVSALSVAESGGFSSGGGRAESYLKLCRGSARAGAKSQDRACNR